MPDPTLADILAAQAGAPGPVYEGGPTGNVRYADVLAAMARMPFPISMVPKAIGAAALPGDVASGRTEADLTNPEYTGRAADLASFMVGSPGGSGGVGSGIRAYHASPYDFDKFDLSRIGTGEGAQVYGHGFYAAENPAVSGLGGEYYQKFLGRTLGNDEPTHIAHQYLTSYGYDRQAALNGIQEFLDKGINWQGTGRGQLYESARDLLKSDKQVGPRVYELNINAKPEQFLDWEKALKDQPAGQSILNRPPYELGYPSIKPESIGQDAYYKMAGDLKQLESPNAHAAASEYLKSQGIPGIKYLDQGSRGLPADATGSVAMFQGALKRHPDDPMLMQQLEKEKADLAQAQAQQTSNYVVFNPDIIDILKKYGLAGLTMGGVLQAQSEPPPQ